MHLLQIFHININDPSANHWFSNPVHVASKQCKSRWTHTNQSKLLSDIDPLFIRKKKEKLLTHSSSRFCCWDLKIYIIIFKMYEIHNGKNTIFLPLYRNIGPCVFLVLWYGYSNYFLNFLNLTDIWMPISVSDRIRNLQSSEGQFVFSTVNSTANLKTT